MSIGCLVCSQESHTESWICPNCGGLKHLGFSEFNYQPNKFLARWPAGTLYTAITSSQRLRETWHDSTSRLVWLFLYDSDYLEKNPEILEEDKKISPAMHPNLSPIIEHGTINEQPYIAFEAVPDTKALPDWLPRLSKDATTRLYSQLADIVLLLQSGGIQRPIIDPYKIRVFWDKRKNNFDFRWLPLPDLGAPQPTKLPKKEENQEADKLRQEALFTLIVQEKDGSQRNWQYHKNSVSIGRVQGNDLILPEGNISRQHARIIMRGEQLFISDQNSRNGTYVNGQRIERPYPLQNHDKIYIGDLQLQIRYNQEQLRKFGSQLHYSSPSLPEFSTDIFAESFNKQDLPGEPTASYKTFSPSFYTRPKAISLPSYPSIKTKPKNSKETRPFLPSIQSLEELIPVDEIHKDPTIQAKDPTTSSPSETLDGIPAELIQEIAAAQKRKQNQTPQEESIEAKSQEEDKSAPPTLDPSSPRRSTAQRQAFVDASSPIEYAQGTEESQQRKGVIRYYDRMNTNALYPLLVTIAQEDLLQNNDDKRIQFHNETPYVRVVPVVPGCLISPSESRLDLRNPRAEAIFWLTPLVEADLQNSAQVQFWMEHDLKDEIPIPTQVNGHKWTKLFAGLSVATIAFKALGSNFSSTIHASNQQDFLSQCLLSILQFVQASGMTLTILFAIVACISLVWFRPSEGDVIERYLNETIH